MTDTSIEGLEALHSHLQAYFQSALKFFIIYIICFIISIIYLHTLDAAQLNQQEVALQLEE